MHDLQNQSKTYIFQNIPSYPNGYSENNRDSYNIDTVCLLGSSKDNVNAQGKGILNLCNEMDLRILNGRFGLDSMEYTCKESSIVDYVIVSPRLMSAVLAFKVED